MPLVDGCDSLYVLYFSVCVCNFTCRPDETYALVGTAKDLTLNPRSCAGGFIHAYKIAELIDGGYKLEFVHKVKAFAQYVYQLNLRKLACDGAARGVGIQVSCFTRFAGIILRVNQKFLLFSQASKCFVSYICQYFSRRVMVD